MKIASRSHRFRGVAVAALLVAAALPIGAAVAPAAQAATGVQAAATAPVATTVTLMHFSQVSANLWSFATVVSQKSTGAVINAPGGSIQVLVDGQPNGTPWPYDSEFPRAEICAYCGDTALEAGVHAVTATYIPPNSRQYLGSTSEAQVIQVTQIGKLTVTQAAVPAEVVDSVKITVSVPGGATGLVDGWTMHPYNNEWYQPLDPIDVTNNPTTSFTSKIDQIQRWYQFGYEGDANFDGSHEWLTVKGLADRSPAKLNLSATRTSATGTAVVLKAGLPAEAAGRVTFKLAGRTIGAVDVRAGEVAQFTTTGSAGGLKTKLFSAVYSGDLNWQSAVSATIPA